MHEGAEIIGHNLDLLSTNKTIFSLLVKPVVESRPKSALSFVLVSLCYGAQRYIYIFFFVCC